MPDHDPSGIELARLSARSAQGGAPAPKPRSTGLGEITPPPAEPVAVPEIQLPELKVVAPPKAPAEPAPPATAPAPAAPTVSPDDLARLERELTATLAPAAGRSFWVYHPSWAYFAEAFGLRQQAVEQEGREPSGRQLARLIEEARAARARVLFADPQFNPGPVRALARQPGARVVTLDPLAEAWPDNLRHVAAAIRDALQESTP